MTTLTHRYVNPQPDDMDPNVTGPDEWNDDHQSDHAFVVLGAIPTNLTGARQLAVSGPVSLTDGGAGGLVTIGFTPGSLDHGSLAGLLDDDHTQYALLAGRSGGQILFGGTVSGNVLDLVGSSDSARGAVYIGANAFTSDPIVVVDETVPITYIDSKAVIGSGISSSSATLEVNGSIVNATWAHFGSVATPTNTGNGDVTATNYFGTIFDASTGYRIGGTATSGHVLRGNGTNFVDAALNAADIANGQALTKVDDTNVTLALGGSPASALLAATSLTLGWTGQLGLARGGTNANLSATGGTGQYLKQSSAGAAITVGTISSSDLPGSFSGFANPTASVGLTAVNGSATTAMRSDAAPPLSQAIAPTWTGAHIWNAGAVVQITVNTGAIATGSPSIVMRGANNTERFQIQSYGSAAPQFDGLGAGGTVASPTRTTSDMRIWGANGLGYNNAGTPAQVGPAAAIRMNAAEDWTTTAFGTYISFYISPTTTQTLTETMRISGASATKGVQFNGYGNFAASITTPSNTTAGDFTALRFHFGTDAAMSASASVGEVRGAIGAPSSSSSTLMAITDTTAMASGVGGAINFGGKYQSAGSGGGETSWAAIAGQKTNSTDGNFEGFISLWARANGSSGMVRQLVANISGVKVAGYLGIGSLSDPTNTTAGDITGTRLFATTADMSTGYRIGGAAASGNYLRGNGTNFVSNTIQAGDLPGSFSGFANPTASVALSAVNGSATTAMRSDAAPALSQAIAPNWTGAHNWTNNAAGYMTTWQRTSATASQWGFVIDSSGHLHLDQVGVKSVFDIETGTAGQTVTAYRFTVQHLTYVGVINGGGLPIDQGLGTAFSWNYSGGSAECDIWNCYIAGTPGASFVFKQLTSAVAYTDLIYILPTGSFLNAGYINVGSLSAPAHTTAGDLNCVNVYCSNIGFFTHATGNYMIEYVGTGTGAITYGHYIDTSSQYHLDAVGVAQICLWTSGGDYQILGNNATKATGTAWINPSDARIKNVTGPFSDGLATVLQLQPKRWIYNELAWPSMRGNESMGFVAQDLQGVADYMVIKNKGMLGNEEVDDLLSYDGHALSFILVNAIKELSAQVDDLKAQLAARNN